MTNEQKIEKIIEQIDYLLFVVTFALPPFMALAIYAAFFK